MPRILKDYPDLGEAVMLLVEQWYPAEFAPRGDDLLDFRTGRVFPPDLQDTIVAGDFFARVADIGGNDDGLTDRPLVDIQVFGSTYKGTRDLAKGIQSRLLGYPWRVGSTVIDKVRTAMRPHEVPWGDDRITSFYSSYTVSARR